ncbi:TPA: hypothetical protein ACOECG_004236, partial [Stenotrophomonas maltophilia]
AELIAADRLCRPAVGTYQSGHRRAIDPVGADRGSAPRAELIAADRLCRPTVGTYQKQASQGH